MSEFGKELSKFGYPGASVSEQGQGLGIKTSLNKFCLDIESLEGGGAGGSVSEQPQCIMFW